MVMMLPQTLTHPARQMRVITWFIWVKSRNLFLWLSSPLDTIAVSKKN
uniref:Uncharacterized protein n=1 Tax=Arundo donax TaxID=35708 RepID=A0A0A9F2H7_ARUDO